MNCSSNCQFGEKEQITDLLMSEKYMACIYESALVESATPEVRQCLTALLQDTNSAAQQIFEEMNSRGWYPVTKAQDMKLEAEKQKFAGKVCK